MLTVLLTHTPEARENYYGSRALDALRSVADVKLHSGDEVMTSAEIVVAAQECDVIISDRATALPETVFANLLRLKAVMRNAVDIRNIDVDAASKAGVLVTRATPGFRTSMVELALGFLCDLSRGISRATESYHGGVVPKAAMGRELSGSTVGIVGYGFVAHALAPVLAALGMKVLVYSPYDAVEYGAAIQTDFDELLASSDYVICLAGATEETENLFEAQAFGRMGPNAFFINLSRGNLVDETALADVLMRNGIAGAALDVGRAPDQMPSPIIARLPNVIATPHIGGLTRGNSEHQALDTVMQVTALTRNEVPPFAVNADRWTRHGCP